MLYYPPSGNTGTLSSWKGSFLRTAHVCQIVLDFHTCTEARRSLVQPHDGPRSMSCVYNWASVHSWQNIAKQWDRPFRQVLNLSPTNCISIWHLLSWFEGRRST